MHADATEAHARRAAAFNARVDAERAARSDAALKSAGDGRAVAALSPSKPCTHTPQALETQRRHNAQSAPTRAASQPAPLSGVDADAARAARILAVRFGAPGSQESAEEGPQSAGDADAAAAQRILDARFAPTQEGAQHRSASDAAQDATTARILRARFGAG